MLLGAKLNLDSVTETVKYQRFFLNKCNCYTLYLKPFSILKDTCIIDTKTDGVEFVKYKFALLLSAKFNIENLKETVKEITVFC